MLVNRAMLPFVILQFAFDLARERFHMRPVSGRPSVLIEHRSVHIVF
jgi:hypothetical protein